MRTRAKGNVINAVDEPLGGVILEKDIPIVSVVQDLVGGIIGSFSVADESVYLYPAGRSFTITASTGNDGIYTVLTDATYDAVTDRTIIPVVEIVPSAVVDGVISGFGIGMNLNNISNLIDPTDPQDCATKNYIDNTIIAAILPILNSLIVPGSIVAWTSDVIPAAWHLCDGSSKTTASEPDLFAAIGYSYGGAGATFNVPDLRGRFPLGSNTAPIVATNRVDRVEATTLGGISGNGRVTLVTNEMATHSHTGTTTSNGTHTHSGTTGNAGSHDHDIRARDVCVDGSTQQGALFLDLLKDTRPLKPGLTDTESNHNHSITGMSIAPDHTHSVTVNSQGGGAPDGHENLPPYQTVNYIIKG